MRVDTEISNRLKHNMNDNNKQQSPIDTAANDIINARISVKLNSSGVDGNWR